MDFNSRMTACVVVMVAIVNAPAVDAQTLNIKPGETLFRTDTSARRSKGIVQGIGPSGLTALVDGKEQQWPLAETRELWREGDSLRNGALIGLATGFGAGLVGGLVLYSVYQNEGGDAMGPLVAMTVLGAAGGLGVGVGFDALFRGRTLVYRQSPSPVVIAPVLSGDRRGVQVAVKF